MFLTRLSVSARFLLVLAIAFTFQAGIAHGGRPELEGRTFLNTADAKKNPVVASMVSKLLAVAKTEKKEGAVSYLIPKAGQTTPLVKIAYTRVFEPWGWSISTGAYIGDIEDAYL